MTRSIVIVGAGQCGAAAAMTLRQAGFPDRIILVGDEPYPPYERPPLSKHVIVDDSSIPPWVYPRNLYRENRIELLLGVRATAVDSARRIVTTTRGEISYGRLLIATGGAARTLSLCGVTGETALMLRTWSDAMTLRARLATARHVSVVGGGLIGLELASTARQWGLDVTVIETASSLLPRLAPEVVSGQLLALHQEHGVDVLLNRRLRQARRSRGRWKVEMEDGRRFLTDVIVAGVGLTVNQELAICAGCLVEDGIVVDGRGATSIPGVFAAGDCARFQHSAMRNYVRWENYQHAIKHGAHVARCMLGENTPYAEISCGWTEQFGAYLQFAGNVFAGNELSSRRISEDGAIYCSNRDGLTKGAVGWNAVREMRKTLTTMRKQAAVGDPAAGCRNSPLRESNHRA